MLITPYLQIWQIADEEDKGFLTPPGFGKVLRLIGYAQAGRPVSAALALKCGLLQQVLRTGGTDVPWLYSRRTITSIRGNQFLGGLDLQCCPRTSQGAE
jgi:hypothetical protein